MNDITYKPIGVFHTDHKQPAACPQQPTDSHQVTGIIKLNPAANYQQALEDLHLFSHIWVVFHFHKSDEQWKPKVQPPRGSDQKRGVFATRSPYRPNAIGISAVQLVKIKDLEIHIRSHDLLDQTPILDIKPYLAYADHIAEANNGWLKLDDINKYQIVFSDLSQQQLDYLASQSLLELKDVITSQLQFEPFNNKHKRIKQLSATNGTLAYRTWRIDFTVSHANTVKIEKIYSGYSRVEIAEPADTYQDKPLHLSFMNKFK